MNSTFLIMPLFIFIIIRGWFFEKSWRKKRLRNTIMVILIFSMVFGFMPMPSHAQAASSEIGLWFMEHVKERLAKMYGDEELIPPGRAPAQVMPPFENAALLRDAALYFVPGKYKKEIDRAYTRTASLLRDDVKRMASNDRGAAARDAGEGRGAGDPTRALAGASADSSAEGILSTTFSVLNSLFGVQEAAAAWSGDITDADSIRFYHTDHLGSVRIITDGAGDIFESIDYQPFGEIGMDTMTNDWRQERHKFTGQMFDSSTGLYYYGARHYDPETGRFTQADTMVPNPLDSQDFNRYTYANNNPYKFTDPSGHASQSWGSQLGQFFGAMGADLGGKIGAIVGFALGVGLALAGGGSLGAVLVGGLAFSQAGAQAGARIGGQVGFYIGAVVGTAAQFTAAVIMNVVLPKLLSFGGYIDYAAIRNRDYAWAEDYYADNRAVVGTDAPVPGTYPASVGIYPSSGDGRRVAVINMNLEKSDVFGGSQNRQVKNFARSLNADYIWGGDNLLIASSNLYGHYVANGFNEYTDIIFVSHGNAAVIGWQSLTQHTPNPNDNEHWMADIPWGMNNSPDFEAYFFETVNEVLVDGGNFYVHACDIGQNDAFMEYLSTNTNANVYASTNEVPVPFQSITPGKGPWRVRYYSQ